MSSDADLLILPALPRVALAAFELIFGSLSEADRHLEVQSLLVEGLPVEGLLEARRGENLVGAILAVRQPGRTGVVWLPRLVKGEPSTTADRLLEAAHEWLNVGELSMVYTALATVSDADDQLLRRHGYESIARILYLVSTERDFPPARPPSDLDFEPYTEVNHERLATLVEATYEQTQDCPRLAGVRDVDDVLTGYRHAGESDTRHWRLVRRRDRDIGCLLVADHPAHGSCELIYMGLAASSRGHGWGKQIARHAQWLAAAAGRPRLVAAVDTANDPAVAVYTSVGFHAWDRRTVYVRIGGRLRLLTSPC